MKSLMPWAEYIFMMCQSTGAPPDLDHGFRADRGLLADAGAHASGQNDGLHRAASTGNSNTPCRKQQRSATSGCALGWG